VWEPPSLDPDRRCWPGDHRQSVPAALRAARGTCAGRCQRERQGTCCN